MNQTRRRLLAATTCVAATGLAASAPLAAADKFLDVQQAFRFSSKRIDAKTVELRWVIAPGYYLYRDRFKFTAEGGSIQAPTLPHGERKFDENFGEEMEVFKHEVVVPIAVDGTGVVIKAVAQGCAEAGLCYPPTTFTARADA